MPSCWICWWTAAPEAWDQADRKQTGRGSRPPSAPPRAPREMMPLFILLHSATPPKAPSYAGMFVTRTTKARIAVLLSRTPSSTITRARRTAAFKR
jgi:hypothetical protein